MKSQKEISLKNDLQLRDRQDVYRNFLLYCMSGDTVALPMGSTVVVERDESEFARLSQLGDVLGLTQLDVGNVHKELAETAFRNQVWHNSALFVIGQASACMRMRLIVWEDGLFPEKALLNVSSFAFGDSWTTNYIAAMSSSVQSCHCGECQSYLKMPAGICNDGSTFILTIALELPCAAFPVLLLQACCTIQRSAAFL